MTIVYVLNKAGEPLMPTTRCGHVRHLLNKKHIRLFFMQAKQKYCKQKKISVYSGAAYVIARRGQGYTDNYFVS